MISDSKAFNQPAGRSVMAMITSAGNAPLPLDTHITDLKSAGLSAPSVVRMKLFTLDHRFVIRKAGCLSSADGKKFEIALRKALHA